MILLSKKRIILLILFIFISVLIYLVCSSNLESAETVETSNISNIEKDKRTIIVDPGHRCS